MMSETGLTPDQLRENNGPYLNIAIWTLAGVSTVFLILRVHCKRRQSKGLWWDDHVLAASWVGNLTPISRHALNPPSLVLPGAQLE